MAVGKWGFLLALSLGLGFGTQAAGREQALDPMMLSNKAAGEAERLDRLWSGMEIGADSLWSELRPDVERQRALSFTPTGPADPHWADRGVDMEALLASAPGGAAANVLYSDDADGPTILAQDGAVLALLDADWRRLGARDYARTDGPSFVSLLAITPAHLLVSQEAWERVGKGYCPRDAAPAPADRMTLYRDRQAPFDERSDRDSDREGIAFSVWTAVTRAQTPRLCWIYVEVAPGVYESRSYDRAGRPLGAMDGAARRLRIVPASDLRAMLTARIGGQGSVSAR